MILFFAWTDMHLINFLNTKCNFYKNENADLLVYKRDRVSGRLLEILSSKRIFSEIYIIELPGFYKENEVKKLDKIQYISIHLKLKKYFISKMKGMIKDKKYEKLLVAAFWCETLNVYKHLKKLNRDIRIEMVEEGMANYNGDKNWIFRTAPSSNIKSLIRGVFYCKNLGVTARKRVKCIYLYEPVLSWTHQNKNIKKLPAINKKNNEVVYQIFEEWQEKIDSSRYMKCKYIYIVDAPDVEKDLDDVTINMIDGMSDSMKNDSVIKLHPLCGRQAENGHVKKREGIWIDDRKIPIENILFYCNINDKVLIANQTSALLYLKCMLNKEPYVIFTYKLQPYYKKNNIKKFDFFSEKLKTVYLDPNKIIIPGTLEEFQIALKNVK